MLVANGLPMPLATVILIADDKSWADASATFLIILAGNLLSF